ncbi:heme biosynthesis HemY N-terminal domain-containing protein [Psychromonas antarctica]|uniref:heme biosynthesis HemY N-terminal domain-containing protein n=1 Tax=Psychromonas antarctica TaxID=67573 RepID=UPI001EE820AA|nr:heme biosynthesis HemY N-terminal domain-containing protein [Psychromonas antarctica]MCG6200072.1 heme biosynthesis protein HemY [Psychromonas antarctica]
MMRIIIIIAVLLAGLILGPEISANKGYILVSFDAYTTYEMTIINAIFIAIVFYFLLLFAEWLLRKLLSMSALTRGWFGRHRTRKAQKNSVLGMLALFEGDTKQAQKLLEQSAPRSESPALTYIAAAKAAHSQKKYDLRDEYLQQACDSQPACELAAGLVGVELQLEAKQYENALTRLESLENKFPKNRRISELYLLTYPALGKWQQYLGLLNTKRRAFSFDDQAFDSMLLDAHQHLFKQLALQSADALKSYWEKKTSRWMHKDLHYQQILLDAYIAAGYDKFAEQFLLDKLNKQFLPALLTYLDKLTLSDHYPLILLLEKKLKKEPQTGLIHQALAKLKLKEDKVNAAIEHLKISIETVPNSADFVLLANLLEKEDCQDDALYYYRKGLIFATSVAPL